MASISTINPTGTGMVVISGTSITNSVTTPITIFSDTVIGGNLAAGRWYNVDAFLALTVPVSLLPTLTLTLNVGSDSLALTTAALLTLGKTNGPVHVRFFIILNTTGSQSVYAELLGDNTGLIPGASVVPVRKIMSQDFTTDKVISITATFSTATSNTTLTIDAIVRQPY